MDSQRVESAVRELLLAIGEDPDRDELVSTPRRVAEAYSEFFSGVGVDASHLLSETFPLEPDVGAHAPQPVLVRGISFRSVCEHHLLPFLGTAHIAYVPSNRLIGLGRLPAIVDIIASRPQLQERLGEQIAQTIADGLDARGVLVVLEASHGCVTMRGARQTASSTVTIAARGSLAEPAARAEILMLIGAIPLPSTTSSTR
ncbi:GTP cyclohydrolase I [Subtercola sp. PAMC28395]|uniref:GTP cyclohydrolase I n=1 Tax=Subtercola sp. PAMC28395 TaxID=2846775 RepID=UPI001C0AB4A2|nr:GTP cyclohydrolase I [Subtercola sp. PAMC28395]QWT25208.1 GTP cyclohydrolase I [Subtercola sp. PAMC28395]